MEWRSARTVHMLGIYSTAQLYAKLHVLRGIQAFVRILSVLELTFIFSPTKVPLINRSHAYLGVLRIKTKAAPFSVTFKNIASFILKLARIKKFYLSIYIFLLLCKLCGVFCFALLFSVHHLWPVKEPFGTLESSP